jgi:uncharacterized protein YdeI (YjbR/CyaY-like superfamily)
MADKPIKTVEVSSRAQWRAWLAEHHDSTQEIWLVFHKQATGVVTLSYNDSVEEALCFGWVDSLIRRLDDARYARKFTPRKPDSKWSTINRRRYAAVKARGLLQPPGLDRPTTARSGDAPKLAQPGLPEYIEEALIANPKAKQYFDQLAPSYRRAYLGWIDSAKRDETKQKRLAEAVEMLAAGKKLGLK